VCPKPAEVDRLQSLDSRISFDFCALKYLNMWLNEESRWVRAMSSGVDSEKLAAMFEFGAAYRISRNLYRKYEVDAGLQLPRLQPVLEIIDPLTADDFAGKKLVPAVEKVCARISERYGGRGVQSATTKFLWLKLQSPIVIYDRQARIAVGSSTADLSDYYARWHALFQDHRSEIAAACARLDEVRQYTVEPPAITPDFMRDIASQKWFHERVFDIYLWSIGTNL